MDKRSLLALALITVVVIIWLMWQSSNVATNRVEETAKDKTEEVSKSEKKKSKDKPAEEVSEKKSDSLKYWNKYGYFAKFASGKKERIVVETDLVKATISSKGGVILKWQLKEYKTWAGAPTQLIWNDGGELFLKFRTFQNQMIDTRDLFFEIEGDKKYYRVQEDEKLTLKAKIELEDGESIVKTFTFYGNKYYLDNDIILENMGEIIPDRGYDYCWTDGLRYQEENSVDESAEALAMTVMSGGVEEIDASGDDPVKPDFPTYGMIDYVAVKIKYFAAAIIPMPQKEFEGKVDMSGRRKHVRNDGVVEKYDVSFRLPYAGGKQKRSFRVYVGPIDYDLLKDLHLEETVNFGWRFLIRPIGEYFMLPIFNFVHSFTPNYGVAIIVFAIIIKFLLYPLSIGQMKSAQKMKLLGPEMAKIREKYKDDQQKQQRETMKLYSDYGINPMGGCLPLLAQMPILYAMWTIMRTNIQLRQSEFILWITDLSMPDVIIELPFKIPIFGLDKFSGLALLMGVTMFFQQKMTITDPRQKALVYMMPVMFTLIFSNFPSGLNLYYFVFNVLGIAQQFWMNKFSKNQPTLESLRQAPKKEGWFQKKLREAQEIAEAQGKSVPGSSSERGAPPPNVRKKKRGPKKPNKPKR